MRYDYDITVLGMCSTQVGDQVSSFKFEKSGDVSDVQRGKWVTKERRCSYLPLGNKRIFLLFKHGGKFYKRENKVSNMRPDQIIESTKC